MCSRCPLSLACFIWQLEINWFAIPVVFLTAFVLLGAEEVAIQLEQPFGDDQSTHAHAHNRGRLTRLSLTRLSHPALSLSLSLVWTDDLPLDSYCFNLEADLMTLLDEKLEDVGSFDDVDLSED